MRELTSPFLPQVSIDADSGHDNPWGPLDDAIFTDATDAVVIHPEPSFSDVLAIVEEAALCQRTKQSEYTWNSAVHFPLLRTALHGGQRRRRDAIVDFTACTTAQIIKEYLPSSANRKMVDFVLFINATEVSPNSLLRAAADKIDRHRASLPMQSINHTDFPALLNVPLAVSMETKRSGQREEEADLQIMTWQAAQWKMLRELVRDSNRGSDKMLDELPFLPSLIVYGHEWRFAACTRDGNKKVSSYSNLLHELNHQLED